MGNCDFCGQPVPDRPDFWRVCQTCVSKGTLVETRPVLDLEDCIEQYEKDQSKNLDPPTSIKMPFGKYRGQRIEEIDSSYLNWISENTDISERNPLVYQEIQNQLAAREGKGIRRGKRY